MRLKTLTGLLAYLACTACSSTMQPEDFSANNPELKPLAFFAGHTHSQSIIENTSGLPTEVFENDGYGTIDADGTLHLTQHFKYNDGRNQERVWIFQKTGDHSYEGTANDVSGVAKGESYGNVFHMTFTLETSPGNSFKDVDLEEWMYLQPDGNVVNRVLVRKLGLTIAMVTEFFYHMGK